MFRTTDPFTFTLDGPLSAEATIIGGLTVEYEARYHEDVQLISSTPSQGTANTGTRKYVLTCTQRVKVYNPDAAMLSPQKDQQYLNYPALLNPAMTIQQPSGVAIQLLGYSPQTVNSKVQTSGTQGSSTGVTSSSSNSATVGSSTAQTNSFSVSVGMTGEIPSFGATAETSTTVTTEQSSTTASESGQNSNRDASAGAAMSIKDWGAFGVVNPATTCPSWIFGQEYPWDAVECRRTTGSTNPRNPAQVELLLPAIMTSRLSDGSAVLPPSHLSMFGVNFVMKSQWLVTIVNTNTDSLALIHYFNYFAASHGLGTDGIIHVYMDNAPTMLRLNGETEIVTKLDLGLLALDPIKSSKGTTVVGFIPSKFTVKPQEASAEKAPVPFCIFANNNTLLVRDTTVYSSAVPAGVGFAASPTALSAQFSGACPSLTYTLFFKITDTDAEYTLYLKHWKLGAADLKLTIVINGDTANPITKYVDAIEAEGGEHNLLSITLRNLDFAAVDYTDLLALGLNSIDITVAAVSGTSGSYALRAVSIEQG